MIVADPARSRYADRPGVLQTFPCAIDHGIAGRYHLKRVEEYDGMIAQWMLRHTQAEFMEQLNKFDALATPVNDIETLLADPHVRDRGTVVTRTFG